MSEEKKIVKGPIGEVKKKIKELDSVDYQALIKAEKSGQNRKTLIKWLDSQKESKVEEKPKKTTKKKIKKIKPVKKIKYHDRKKLSNKEKRIFRLRTKEKNAIPQFIRQEYTKLKRLKDVWRKPKGEDSKQAEDKRGKPKRPKIGYKKSRETRGFHPSGYIPSLVHNTAEIENIDPLKEAIIIAGSVGRKKRNEIIKTANKNRITILNPRKGEL